MSTEIPPSTPSSEKPQNDTPERVASHTQSILNGTALPHFMESTSDGIFIDHEKLESSESLSAFLDDLV